MTDEQWQAAIDYIELLESCQDGYYRASESDEAKRWHALRAAPTPPAVPPTSTPGSPLPLDHWRSCAALIDDNDCTCGLTWRVRLVTEQEMHAAWRKRAEEAEAREMAVPGFGYNTPPGRGGLVLPTKIHAAPPTPETPTIDAESELRREWWVGHGHTSAALYGDDGEMQCKQCRVWDYRRAPLSELRTQVHEARLVRVAAALVAPVGETPAVNLVAHLRRQREFSARTFGPGARVAGVLDHIRKELAEIEAEPSDLFEWIDVVLLALDGAWRAGHEPEAIAAALVAKQAKNEARTWPDWRTQPAGQAITHVKAPGETPATAPSENVCTAEKPMPKGAPGQWVHPSASCVYSGDDYDRFECPLCGQRFAVTVPQ